MTGYRVGDRHPSCAPRQWCTLTEAEVAYLADELVFALARSLARLDVAGATDADGWELSDQLRDLVARHHREARRRARGQRHDGR